MGYYGIGFEISVEATYPIDEGKLESEAQYKISNCKNNSICNLINPCRDYILLLKISGMGTAFIFFSGQVQGALLLLLSEAFESPLTPEALEISVN